MSEGLNPAEQVVFELCRRSFLRLWSYANPQGKDRGKELCDVLVVVPPDVVVFSVKDIALGEGKEPRVERSRWIRRAIEASAKQIYGAERQLRASTHVTRSDGTVGISLPNKEELRVHRVAVAAGSRGKAPILFGDFGKGFVHVLDEWSAQLLLSEVDTVTDFVKYLREKERFCSGVRHLVQVREEDFLAMYLHGGRKLPEKPPEVFAVADELWESFASRPEVIAKKQADAVSYVWDRLIDDFAGRVMAGSMEPGGSPENAELGLRIMAQEDRFSRRVLGEAFQEFWDESREQALARMMVSPSGVVYVFLAFPHDADREHRQRELLLRCIVARGLHAEATTAVGIATEQHSPEGYSMDLAVHHQVEWRTEHDEMLKSIQRDLGYFANPRRTGGGYDEYPGVDSST